jgi:hypothetical protein
MIFRTRWYDRDFYKLQEENLLSHIILIYGAYLIYSTKIDDMSSFLSYYNKNKNTMKYIFINTANGQIKTLLRDHGIKVSGRKLRQLYFTNKNRVVRSYTWINDFLLLLFEKIEENSLLYDLIIQQYLYDCLYCKNESDLKYILLCCTKKILGFQYGILNRFSKYSTKKGLCAKECLESILNSKYMMHLQTSCKASKI